MDLFSRDSLAHISTQYGSDSDSRKDYRERKPAETTRTTRAEGEENASCARASGRERAARCAQTPFLAYR